VKKITTALAALVLATAGVLTGTTAANAAGTALFCSGQEILTYTPAPETAYTDTLTVHEESYSCQSNTYGITGTLLPSATIETLSSSCTTGIRPDEQETVTYGWNDLESSTVTYTRFNTTVSNNRFNVTARGTITDGLLEGATVTRTSSLTSLRNLCGALTAVQTSASNTTLQVRA